MGLRVWGLGIGAWGLGLVGSSTGLSRGVSSTVGALRGRLSPHYDDLENCPGFNPSWGAIPAMPSI